MNDDEPSPERTGEYYVEHSRSLGLYVKSIVRRRDVVEDVVQEAYVRLHEGLCNGTVREVRPWLWRVAHNLAVDYMRELKRTPLSLWTTSGCEPASVDEDEEEPDWKKYEPHLETALSVIPPSRSDLLREHYFGGKPYQEIADERCSTEDNVKVAAFRARKSLQTALEKAWDERQAMRQPRR